MKYMVLFEFCQKHQVGAQLIKSKDVLSFLLDVDLEKLMRSNSYDFVTHGRILTNKVALYQLKAVADPKPLSLL
jgi:hypothetical protein